MAKKAVIIIPTYNEKENIDRLLPVLVGGIFSHLPNTFDPHILVVDDSSPDGTADVVKKHMEKHKTIHLLVNKKKGGLGKAYMSGMQYALDKLDADIVFEFDADFSHDPKKIGPMLEKIDQGYDLVLASRYIKGGSIPGNWGLHRKFLSVFGNFVIQLIITNFSIKDWTTGYRAITKEVVKTVLPEMAEDKFTGYTFQIGFLHKTVRKNFNVAEIPLQFIDREYGHSKLGSEYIKNTLRYILKVRYDEITSHRLFKFAMVGIVGATVQFSSLKLFRFFIGFQIANILATEMAIISNFIFSNRWTFADRKLAPSKVLGKFLQFNMTSAAAIVIQAIVAFIGVSTFGLIPLFAMPLLGTTIDSGYIYTALGIFISMFWNYLAYSRIIWKTTQH